MPTYQYRCTECGRDLEVVQKFSDASLTECPTCSGALRKVFNAVGVVFKGSGFYRTDSRAANGNGSSSSDSGGDKGSGDKKSDSGDKSTEKKSDSTPAKTETKAGSDSASGSKVPAGSTGSSSTGSKAASS